MKNASPWATQKPMARRGFQATWANIQNDSLLRTQPQDLLPDPSHSLPWHLPARCYWDTSNPWDTSSLWDQSFKNYSNYKRLQNTSFFSLHKVEHSHRELWEVRVSLCTTGITFEQTASNPSIGGAHEIPHQRAPSATPGLTARLGGHWQTRSCSIKILRSTASYFSKRAGSDLMIFIDTVKSKLFCWHRELMRNLFCWAGTESSGGLSLWLFFSL